MGSRVLISMPEQFLSEIDNVAQSENRTRSELIREALRVYMRKQHLTNQMINKGAVYDFSAALLENFLE